MKLVLAGLVDHAALPGGSRASRVLPPGDVIATTIRAVDDVHAPVAGQIEQAASAFLIGDVIDQVDRPPVGPAGVFEPGHLAAAPAGDEIGPAIAVDVGSGRESIDVTTQRAVVKGGDDVLAEFWDSHGIILQLRRIGFFYR